MIKSLHLENIGPAPSLDLSFTKGVNVFTGDNGVGKSFILDVIWWTLTRQWPQVINNRLINGRMAQPAFGETGTIEATLSGRSGRPVAFRADFNTKRSAWIPQQGRPTRQGLVIYAMVDGSFAIWDPARNYWRSRGDEEERPDAFVFTPSEIWNGQDDKFGNSTCNGIVYDWLFWVMKKGEKYRMLVEAIKQLSPPGEELQLGEILRVQDAREYVSIRMPYGTATPDVPIILLSSAVKRVLAMAYSLIWAWSEHVVASKRIGEPPTTDIILIVDEIEAHLHPKWQRTILRSLRSTITSLTGCKNVQFILSTHSPLVMASCEEFFSSNDSWIDIDLTPEGVRAGRKEFRKRGDASKWLLSPAFDLKSARSVAAQNVLDKAEAFMTAHTAGSGHVARLPLAGESRQGQARKLTADLEKVLPSSDSFWLRWNFFLQKRMGMTI